ncbi:hypothetical protein AB1J88_16925 [Pseudomonas sp. S8]|uniref:hypothetical protein n=1 Tax=Pseudomonas sp. S8 TaxID=211136 RepID=UPI003D2986E3
MSYPRIGNYCHRCRKVCDGTPKIKEISMQTPISELSNGVFDVYDANGKAIARLGFGNYLSMDIAIGQFEVRGFPWVTDCYRPILLKKSVCPNCLIIEW